MSKKPETPAQFLMRKFENMHPWRQKNPSNRHLIDVLADDKMHDDHSKCHVCCSGSGSRSYVLSLYKVTSAEVERDRLRPHP